MNVGPYAPYRLIQQIDLSNCGIGHVPESKEKIY